MPRLMTFQEIIPNSSIWDMLVVKKIQTSYPNVIYFKNNACTVDLSRLYYFFSNKYDYKKTTFSVINDFIDYLNTNIINNFVELFLKENGITNIDSVNDINKLGDDLFRNDIETGKSENDNIEKSEEYSGYTPQPFNSGGSPKVTVDDVYKEKDATIAENSRKSVNNHDVNKVRHDTRTNVTKNLSNLDEVTVSLYVNQWIEKYFSDLFVKWY